MLLSTLMLTFAVVAFASYDQPILGISLGTRDFTAVQSLANGSTSLIARVSANATYTNWFEEELKLSEHERSTVDFAALEQAILAIRHAVTQKLQQQTQFRIVTAPKEMRDPVIKTFTKLDLLAPIEVPATNYIRPASAIHYAHGLGTCETADLPTGCDPEDISGEALWLDFDASSLSVRLLSFEEHAADPGTESVFSDLAEMYHTETTSERVISALQEHFSNFLDQDTVLKDFPGRRGNDFKPLRSDIKAIVASGDPPPGSLEAVRLALHRISPDLASRIRGSTDPSLALATGAALRAREMLDRPEIYSANICHHSEEYSHDEL
ncbi:hypothetical protein QM012_009490 [Aureobasidium pullulans]|uniref:Aminoglycoside phosphotransferase domain-containing protein n=1 Tax=Aureobasidium pullulans TaxID=5580 RepID=A0ABR0TH11_AURPU